MRSSTPICPKCSSNYTYEDGNLYVCPECNYEWAIDLEPEIINVDHLVKDAHGNILKDGDSVTIIKDIKVKRSSAVIKVGVKVKDIRIVEESGGHNIEAKVKGIGIIMLKSEFVKKSN